MQISIATKKIELTGAMNNEVQKKIAFMDKFLKKEDVVHIKIKKEGKQFIIKSILPSVYKDIIVTHKHEDFYICLDILVNKIKETYFQDKGKFKTKKKEKSPLPIWCEEKEKIKEIHAIKEDEEIEGIQFKYI